LNEIPINLAVEDTLSEAVVRRLLEDSPRGYCVGTCYMRHGSGYLRRMIKGFNNAAKGTPFLVLTDLNSSECPPVLIQDWLPVPKQPNLLFRVAVREVESWILADTPGLCRFLRVRAAGIPADVDSVPDPKRLLIRIAEGSPNRQLVRDIVPAPGTTSVQGPGYNMRLEQFVSKQWRPQRAAERSASLRRTLDRIASFSPVWGSHGQNQPRG
jgi:hypothetical protein